MNLIILLRSVDIVSGDAVLVTAFGALPDVLVIIESALLIEKCAAAITEPIDVRKSFFHLYPSLS